MLFWQVAATEFYYVQLTFAPVWRFRLDLAQLRNRHWPLEPHPSLLDDFPFHSCCCFSLDALKGPTPNGTILVTIFTGI